MVIFFDLDDTLITHSDAIRSATTTLYERLSLEIGQDAFFAQWQAAHHRYYPRYLRGELSYPALRRRRVREVVDPFLDDEEADRIFDVYMTAYESGWQLFSDVVPCLDLLTAYPLGVISNGPSDEQRRKLRALGIADRFQHVLISEECGCPKPSPEIFLKACRMARVAPRDAVYVGDHYEIDVGGACAAGLRGVWLDRYRPASDPTRPDVVSSLQELPELLEHEAREARTP